MTTQRKYSSGSRQYLRRIPVVMTLIIAIISPAYAFFPLGDFDTGEVLRLSVWRVSDFDNDGNNRIVTDHDLQVSEGLETWIEGGRSGFTEEEIEIVKEALRIWASVPTSYASFRHVATLEEPVPVGEAQGANVDTLSVIAIQIGANLVTSEAVAADPANVTIAFPVGVLGFNVSTFVIDEQVFVIDGENVTVAAGTILDSDIIINGNDFREDINGTTPIQDLLGVMVHEIGHHLGLGHPPLNNLDPLGVVENAVFWMTGPDGVARKVGVTPTMFPSVFDVIDDLNNTKSGQADLSPDEISAISWLYEREGASAKFFNLEETARTIRRDPTPLPSQPIAGGHVVAWADNDNNPSTPRIPMFSTMTGLYETLNEIPKVGNFKLFNLWKQFEVEGANGFLFNSTYTFTLSALNQSGTDRQSPAGLPPEVADTLHETLGFGGYNTIFPSQTFHESGNILDMSNRDAGTPLGWDFDKGRIFSMDTGGTFPNLLGANTPMFGDPLKEGFFNCAVSSSPRGGVSWLGDLMLMLVTGLLLFATGRRGMMPKRAKIVASMLLAIVALSPVPAEAAIANLTDRDLTAMTSDIVAGTVDSVESFRDTRGRVVTEIMIGVQDIVKGRLNKGSNVAVYVSGGVVDGVRTRVSEMPTFKAGEEVLVFLGEIDNFGLSVNAGLRGKVSVQTDSKSKKKYVFPHDPRVKRTIKGTGKSGDEAASAIDSSKDESHDSAANDSPITLQEYKDYLRDIVRAQKRGQR